MVLNGLPKDGVSHNELLDTQIALKLLLNFARQTDWRVDDVDAWIAKHFVTEVGTANLTNTGIYPFNNSAVTIALTKNQPSTNYIVIGEAISASGNVGEVEATERQVNGFKLAFTGSATSATIRYMVIGGFDE